MKIDLTHLPSLINDSFLPLMTDKSRYIIMKGGAGSGKSIFGGQKKLYQNLTEPGRRTLIARKVGRTIRQSIFEQMRGTIADWNLERFFKVNKTDMHIRNMFNGNEMIFSGLDDVEKLKSIFKVTDELIEEASELEVRDYRQLDIRMRGKPQYDYLYKQLVLMFNPISQGHWLKKEFFDNPKKNATIHQSTYKDNKFLDAEAIAVLEAFKESDPYYYQVYCLNEWGSVLGCVFPEFRDNPGVNNENYFLRRHTHVITPFKIPETWRRYRVFDFGYSKPFSVGWYAVDHDGRIYRYRALYGCTGEPDVGVKWHPKQIAQEIKKIEDEHEIGHHITGIADPSIWDKSRGESVAEQMESERIYFDKADNKRVPGKMQVHYRLAFDEEGLPMFYVFNTDKHFLRTIPELKYDEKKPEDVDTKQEDHIYDELRYMCNSCPIAPRLPKKPIVEHYDPFTPDKKPQQYPNFIYM